MDFPISTIQKQFYINSMMYPKDTSYLIPSVFIVNGCICIEALEKSINSIVARHDILRSFYIRKGKQIVQSYIAESDAKIKVEHVVKPQKYEGAEVADVSDEIHKTFNLGKWPLFRVKLISFENEVSILVITFHHIIVDLHSKMAFGSELSNYYNHYAENIEIDVEGNSNTYAEFVSWEKEWLGSSESDRMLDFWKKHLEGSDFNLDLPTDFERPSLSTKNGKRVYYTLGDKNTESVKSFGKKNSINTFTVLLSAYTMLCHRLSKQNHIVVGVPLTNRRKQLHKNVFGPLLNIVPIHVDFSAIRNENDLIKQVRLNLLQAHRNQEIPFLFLLENIEIKKSFSRNAIFQVGFTSEPPMELNFNGTSISPVVLEKLGSQLDIFFTFWEREGEIHILLEYSMDLFKESTILKWLKMYKELLLQIISN